MFFDAFTTTGLAIVQILFLAAIGYFLRKKEVIDECGFNAISKLVIEVTLPAMIFSQLLRDFDFSLYPQWWLFPLLSFAITLVGLGAGMLCASFNPVFERRMQFASLVAFQNSGYLPLAIISTLLPARLASTMLVYLFLFLLGFNLVMWPIAMHMYTSSKEKAARFPLSRLLNMPTIASLAGILAVFLGLRAHIPGLVQDSLRMVGECTIPLALMVVGADLARISVAHFDKKNMAYLCLIKLVAMPLAGIVLVRSLHLPEMVGLLLVMQLAVPCATSLSSVLRYCHKEDLLVSQGIFVTHIVSIFTLPLFMSIYLMMGAPR